MLFYIGSTDKQDAWQTYPLAQDVRHVTGHWNNEPERTAILTVPKISDASAIRLAARIARESGNDCVLIVRPATPLDGLDMRVDIVTGRRASDTGKHTITETGESFVYWPNFTGAYIAALVFPDGTVASLDNV